MSVALKADNMAGWSFNNVIPIKRNGENVKYFTSISAGELAEMYSDDNPKLIYNPNVQRGTKITKKGEIPISSTTKINQIKTRMQNSKLHGSMITLCVPKFDESKDILEYNDFEKKHFVDLTAYGY